MSYKKERIEEPEKVFSSTEMWLKIHIIPTPKTTAIFRTVMILVSKIPGAAELLSSIVENLF